MTDLSTLAASLSDIQRKAILRAKEFVPGSISLTDWMEDSWDIAEGLSERIADPTSGDLTPLGLALRDHLERNG